MATNILRREHSRFTADNLLPRWHTKIVPGNNGVILSFQDIKNGERTLYLDDPDPTDAEITARSAKQTLERNYWTITEHVAIDSPMEVESESGQWFICTFITEIGEAMLAAVEQGLTWDPTEQGIDPKASDMYWRDSLLAGRMHEQTVHRISMLTHPLLQQVKRDCVAYVLGAERDGNGFWHMDQKQAREMFWRG